MSFDSELTTYISTLDTTINNIGTLGAKLDDFADNVETAKNVVEQIDEIGDYAESAREAIDDQLTALKLAKQAGPLKTPAKLFEKVLLKVRPIVEDIEEAVDKLNGKKDKDGEDDDEEGFLEKLEGALDDVETALRVTSVELDTTARDILVSRTSVAEIQVALKKADYSAFDNLKAEVEIQFSGRNAVTEPLGEAFNDIVGKVNGVLGLFSDAKFEVVQEEFGDFAEIAELIDKVAEPLSVVANMLRPVEGVLDAVGFVADLVLDPIFDFFTESLGIDKVLDDLSDEITDLLPGTGFLDDLIAEAQDVLNSLRDFNDTNFGIDQWQLDIDQRLYGATVGEALLGPTGFGSNDSEIFNGDGGDDILDARAGDDLIYGLGGNDIILAGEGNDQVFGGSGTDMVYFDGFFQEYELAKEEGSGKVIVTHVRPEKGEQNEGSTRLDSIEHVVFRNIAFTGQELEESIIGGSVLNGTNPGPDGDGNDLMFLNSSGTTNADGQHVANGLGGNDRIFGSTEDDELNGGTGNDILLPGFGNDEANGGSGIDTFQILDGASNSPTRINLEDGTVFGPEGSDTLSSIENLIVQSGGDHILRGDDKANNMISADGEDILVGRGGDDFMNSGAEDDYLITGSGRDTVLAGDDNDFIIAAADFVQGERETFDGGRGFDVLSYSKDFNTVRDIKNVESDASNAIREALVELGGEAGSVRIFAGTGRVEKLDDEGNVLAVDRAIDIEQFIGSDKDDTLYGARGDGDTRYSIYGAGGNDTLYSQGANLVSGGKGDDLMVATADANGGISGTNFQGDEGFDTLDLTGLGDQRWWFSLDGSISRSIRAYDEDYAGNPRSGGAATAGFNVRGIDEFLLAGGNDLIDHNAGGSAKVTFRTAGGDDELNHRGGFATFYAGSGDDYANMIEGGIVYGGSGDDRIRFDDLGTENEAHGQDGNDTVILKRNKGMADGGTGYDTLAFDLENTAGNDYGFVNVDLEAGTARMVEKRSSNRFENEQVDAKVANFEKVIGTEFGDTIEGSGADETLIGREGNDTLDGREGKDQLFGGQGADSLIGGDDDDRLHGGAGNDRLDGGEGRDTALYTYAAPEGLDGVLSAGNFGGVNVDLEAGTATGSFGEDRLISIEDVQGSAGADRLSGDAFDNLLAGEAGDDDLIGLGGNDILILGSGNDTADGGLGNDRILTGIGVKDIDGGVGEDRLIFGSESGKITVDFAANRYFGKLKADEAVWLDTGTTEARDYNGAMLTPEDVKTASAVFADSADDVSRDLPEADDPESGGLRIRDKKTSQSSEGTFEGIEWIEGGSARVNLVLSDEIDRYDGTNSSRDFIDFSGEAAGIEYFMASGANNLGLASGDDLRGIDGVLGGVGDDRLVGSGAANVLIGAIGDDSISASKGTDRVKGGLGNDKLYAGGGHDLVKGGKGRDNVNGNSGNDRLFGDDGRDKINGGDGADLLNGGGGNDRLTGGSGADTFRFTKGGGRDVIRDFKDDRDVVDLKSFKFDSVDAALDRAVNTSDGDVFFDFGGGDSLLIRNITRSDLSDDLMI